MLNDHWEVLQVLNTESRCCTLLLKKLKKIFQAFTYLCQSVQARLYVGAIFGHDSISETMRIKAKTLNSGINDNRNSYLGDNQDIIDVQMLRIS